MKKLFLLIAILGLPLFPLRAQVHKTSVQSKIGHYVRTHKNMLVADAVVTLAQGADAASTIKAEGICKTCADQGFFGPHPTHFQAYFQTEIGAVGVIAFNAAAYHHYRKGGDDASSVGQFFFSWMFTAPVSFHAYADVQDNVGAINEWEQSHSSSARLAAARNRLLRQ
jgi:hypothetical protein